MKHLTFNDPKDQLPDARKAVHPGCPGRGDGAVAGPGGMVAGVSQRSVRAQKYRGSGFDEDESLFVIGKRGLKLGTRPQEARGP